jgi:endonuclease YncB( thermonuclease family)
MASVAPIRRRLRGVEEYRDPRWRQRSRALPSLRTLLFAAVVGAIGYYAVSNDRLSATNIFSNDRFGACGFGLHKNCVIDGDTFFLNSERIRIADIDAPETNGLCEYEIKLAARATKRLRELLNDGPFELRTYASRNLDAYGRKLRTLHRGGRSIGDILVGEGLARRWTGRRQPWCV